MDSQIGWQHPIDESDQWDGFNEPGIEHFAGDPIRNLARETCQNALDARESDVVILDIKCRHYDPKNIPGFDELYNNMQYCLSAAENESDKAQAFFTNALNELNKREVPVLEISDSNTSGMKGPCSNGTPFYAFMKAKGQSRKDSTNATGSFGIGKFAPYVVSKLRTIFVSTVYQNNDGNLSQLTQGKSILMSHDVDGQRRQGAGFWGFRERCQPVEGFMQVQPDWVQKVSEDTLSMSNKGTKLSILCFDAPKNWQDIVAASVAENFFGAIYEGRFRVTIGDEYVLDQTTIEDFFKNIDVREALSGLSNEPDQFDHSRQYLAALQTNPEVIVVESEQKILGLCELRILIGENLPKKVCVLRNGMFITDSLSRLRSFSDYKEFSAVLQCKNPKGNSLLREMEPPRNDNFEPERLFDENDKRKAKRALREVADWVRETLKRHARDPISDVTEIDELRDYLGDEGGSGEEDEGTEINPQGPIIIYAKRPRTKISERPSYPTIAPESVVQGETVAGNETGTGYGEGETERHLGTGGTSGGGSGTSNGTGPQGGGDSTRGNVSSRPIVVVNNVRSLVSGSRSRRISFTPTTSGELSVYVYAAGADFDYPVQVTKADIGTVQSGSLVLKVTAGSRVSINAELDQIIPGAIKVITYAI